MAKRIILIVFSTLTTLFIHAQDTTSVASEPFAFGDFTWLNGNDRRHSQLLETKYFTGSFLLDVNYNYSFNNPIDNTVVGSTALARHNEVALSFAGIGGDFHYGNTHARIMTQMGTRSTVIPRNDFSSNRGQYDLSNAYRLFSEAYAGHHWNVWHGINLDAGIFMSYIGLSSFYNCENWVYQPSFTSDNTPWYFNGLRLQLYPTDKLKIEIWAINGWQSYGKFNSLPGFGGQCMWRPVEWLSFVTNNYYGTDTQNKPGRIRVHSDNSVQVRYRNTPKSFLSKAAFSVTGDFGFESGDTVSAMGTTNTAAQNFVSGMIYHRLWFNNNHFGWTVGGGVMHNPGRYLVLLPTGEAAVGKPNGFTANVGDKFDAWDYSTTIDWMPNEMETWRLELVHREANVPYFAGRGGVTSPDGFNGTPIGSWLPDLVKSETKIILALLVRF